MNTLFLKFNLAFLKFNLAQLKFNLAFTTQSFGLLPHQPHICGQLKTVSEAAPKGPPR